MLVYSGNIHIKLLIYLTSITTGGEAMKNFGILVAVLLLSSACTPTIKVEAPDKPIEINMNVNIKHEILIKVEKQVEELLQDDLF